MEKLSIESVVDISEIETEDGGAYKCHHVELNDNSDYGLYIKICSWDEGLNHTDFKKFIGKKIKITIEEII